MQPLPRKHAAYGFLLASAGAGGNTGPKPTDLQAA